MYGDALATCGKTCESSGSPCTGDQVCNAGACGAPGGLVVFSVPFTAATQVQRYGNRFSPNRNLTNSALVMRVYVPDAEGGSLFVYPTDGSASSPGPGVRVALDTLSAGLGFVHVFNVGIFGQSTQPPPKAKETPGAQQDKVAPAEKQEPAEDQGPPDTDVTEPEETEENPAEKSAP